MSLRYSPIVDATPLVADSDDDDDSDSRSSASFGNDDDGDEKEDNFVGDVVDIRPGAVGRPNDFTPELASTYSGSSNEGSAVCHNSDENNGRDEAANNGIDEPHCRRPLTAAELSMHEEEGKATVDDDDERWHKFSFGHLGSTNANISTAHNSTNNGRTYGKSTNAIQITPLHQIPYVHGGYAAAAPLFATQSKFASVLRRLLPGAYDELSCLLRNGAKKEKGGGVIKNGSRPQVARRAVSVPGNFNYGDGGGGGVDDIPDGSPPTSTDNNASDDTLVEGDGRLAEQVMLPDPIKGE